MSISDVPNRILFESRYKSNAPHLPFLVTTRKDIWTVELSYWLLEYVGKNRKDWEWEWNNVYMFGFKNEEDKVKFILKWL